MSESGTITDTPPPVLTPKPGEYVEISPEDLKDKLRSQEWKEAFDKQVSGKPVNAQNASSGLPSDASFVPPTADDITHGAQFSEDPPRATAASRMKQKVRDVLDAQPFRGKAVHKDDLIAVIDALIDGPDDDHEPRHLPEIPPFQF